jgi:ABC-type uncharacterized transport system auxiliary subunit
MALRHFHLALALFVAACGSTPESRNIRLDLSGDLPATGARLLGSLQVSSFTARGLLNERRLVYNDAQSPGERKQSASFMWEESPSQAATLVAVQALRSAEVATTVFAPDQPGLADYVLSARLDRFELEQDGATTQARVAIDATVQKTDDRSIRLLGRYCGRSDVSTNDSPALEHAFNDAYREALVSLVSDISRGASRSQAVSC